jgi:hypothetical protein
MFRFILQHINRWVLFGFFVALLTTLTFTINSIDFWALGVFFTILRKMLMLIDFMWATDTMIILITISFSIQIALWIFKGGMAVVKWFEKY